MLYAVKGNREIAIQDDLADKYAKEGFDIYDDKGKLKQASATKTVPFEEHQKVLAELKAAKAKIAELEKPDKK